MKTMDTFLTVFMVLVAHLSSQKTSFVIKCERKKLDETLNGL